MDRIRPVHGKNEFSKNKKATLHDSIFKILLIQVIICFLMITATLVIKQFSGELFLKIKSEYEKEVSLELSDQYQTSSSQKLLYDILGYLQSVFSIKPISSWSSDQISEQQSSNSQNSQSDSSSQTVESNSDTEESKSETSIHTGMINMDSLTNTDYKPSEESILSYSPPNGASFAPYFILGKKIIPVTGHITSNYGYRISPINHEPEFHSGIDISAPMNTDIKSLLSGKILNVAYDAISGNYVTVQHSTNTEIMYAHCKEVKVKIDDWVDAGQIIGSVGDTGKVTGPHLHIQVKIDGVIFDPIWIIAGEFTDL